MSYSIAPDNEWEAPEIDRIKTISIRGMTAEQVERENKRMKDSGFVPGIMTRSVDIWIKRPF